MSVFLVASPSVCNAFALWLSRSDICRVFGLVLCFFPFYLFFFSFSVFFSIFLSQSLKFFCLKLHDGVGLHNKMGLRTIGPEGPRPTPMLDCLTSCLKPETSNNLHHEVVPNMKCGKVNEFPKKGIVSISNNYF